MARRAVTREHRGPTLTLGRGQRVVGDPDELLAQEPSDASSRSLLPEFHAASIAAPCDRWPRVRQEQNRLTRRTRREGRTAAAQGCGIVGLAAERRRPAARGPDPRSSRSSEAAAVRICGDRSYNASAAAPATGSANRLALARFRVCQR